MQTIDYALTVVIQVVNQYDDFGLEIESAFGVLSS